MASDKGAHAMLRTTLTTTERHRRQLAARMDSAQRHLTGLRAMLDIAKAHGMEHHIDRIIAEITEFEGELDDLMLEAIGSGFVPEDFDA